jgi:nitrogen regulatory protein P-II 1
MYVLVQVLEQTELLAQIIEKLAKIGVPGVTVLDSMGMGRILLRSSKDVPTLEIIESVLEKRQSANKTLFAVIEKEETLKKAIEAIKSFCGDLNDPGKGILFVFPLDLVEGIRKV